MVKKILIGSYGTVRTYISTWLTLLIIEVGPWSIINVRRRPGSCELSTSLPTRRNQGYFRLMKSTSTQTRNCTESCPLVISQLTVILNDEQIQLISSWIGLATSWGTASITRSSLSGMFPSLERRLCSKRPI